jgi:hypothetical protein
MLTSELIDHARDRIVALFMEQCEHGPQRAALGDSAMAACGQFLNERRSAQRGIHGTAAALSVLARCHVPDARQLSSSLLNYITHRTEAECAGVKSAECTERTAKLNLDTSNVIKLSEVLWALNFVQPAVGEKESLSRSIAETLNSGIREGRGWSYFVDDRNGPEPLPTAFAVRALAISGYQVAEPISYLLDSMDSPSNGQSDVFVQTFVLFVLTFLNPRPAHIGSDRLKTLLLKLWRRLDSLLQQDLEYNIEYSRNDRYYYVRVPWQLYLAAVAANVAELRVFSTAILQRRLATIIEAATSATGFMYPHSGNRVSSRTNGILYDVLTLIGHEIRRSSGIRAALTRFDAVRLILGSAAVSWIGVFAGLGIAGYATAMWLRRGTASVADLGPHFIAAAIILLLSGRKWQ